MLMMMFSESSRHSESYSSSCDAAEAVRLGKDEKLAREAGITFDVKVMTIMITITVLCNDQWSSPTNQMEAYVEVPRKQLKSPQGFHLPVFGWKSFFGIPFGLHIIWKVIWIHSDAPGHLKTWFHRWLQTESKLLSNSKTCKPRYNTNFTKHPFSRGFHFWKISFNYIFRCGCTK